MSTSTPPKVRTKARQALPGHLRTYFWRSFFNLYSLWTLLMPNLTLIQCLFQTRVTTMAHKRSWSFCQKCRWQVILKHTYTFDPTNSEWADYASVQGQCGNLSRNELTRNLSGNVQPQSSQLTEPLWTDPGIKSKISMCELISTSKKKEKKKHRLGMNGRTFSPNPRKRGKSHHLHLLASHLTVS